MMKIGDFNIGANTMATEMQSQALQAKNIIARDVQPNRQVNNTNSADFGAMLNQAIENVNDLGHKSKEAVTAFEMGDPNVSLADAMIAKEKSGVAFEATLQVRNKVLEAYNKIMQMPV
jgi:flagellar hook-basal body complex protein FliE